MSAADRLRQYAAGKELLELIKTSVRPQDVADRVAALAAKVAEEASGAAAAAPANGKAPAAAAAAAGADAFAAAASVLEGVNMTSPWGKHDIGFGPQHLLLRSSQRVVSIPYSDIQHVAILEQIPKEPKDKNCVALALRKESDIRSGKQRLDVIVAQTKASPEVTVAVAASADLGESLTGAAAVVLCQLLGAHLPDIQDDTFTSSDPSVFRAVSGDLAISANVRTASGWLFPLPGALLFLGKPARFVRHEDVIGAEFARVGVSSTFDLTLNLAGGGQLEFGQIDQGELPRIQAYVAERRLPVGPPDPSAASKPAAAKRPAKGGGGGSDDDDESDEEDSDFDPESKGAAEPGSKRQRTAGGSDAEELGSDDSGEEEEDDDSEDDDEDGSSDVSLVATDDMSDDGGPAE